MPADRWQRAWATALVRRRIRFADSKREVGVVVEEERRDVVVEDHEQHVRLLLGEPSLYWLISLEDRRPGRVVLFMRIQREPDGGRMRAGDGSDDCGHCLLYTSPSPRDS